MPDDIINTEGPLGFPLTERQAKSLDAILKKLPKDPAFGYRKHLIDKSAADLTIGERTDISWITTESVDRDGEIVLSAGMNDSQYKLNPIVTINHDYRNTPAGKSIWRKQAHKDRVAGIRAQTYYPEKPADWPEAKEWTPDIAFSLVQSDLLRGKSIGFLPLKHHFPTNQEILNNGWSNVSIVFDEWLLLEYACVFLPSQQEAVVEAVAKNTTIPFISLATIEAQLTKASAQYDFSKQISKFMQSAIEKLKGRVA